MPTIRAKLVGQSFNQGAKAMEDLLKPGRTVLLVREDNNPYDKNAVEVYVRFGHVNKEVAAILADLFDDGHPALPSKRLWTMAARLGEMAKSELAIYIPEPRPTPPSSPSSNDDEIPF